MPIHRSENLLKASCFSHTVALSLNACFGFFGPALLPVILLDETIREAGKGTLCSVGRNRNKGADKGEEREREKKKHRLVVGGSEETMIGGNLGFCEG